MSVDKGAQAVHVRVDAAGEGEDRVGELGSDHVPIDPANRSRWSDDWRVLALEDGDIAHDEALGGGVEDDVGLVQPALRPRASGLVADFYE